MPEKLLKDKFFYDGIGLYLDVNLGKIEYINFDTKAKDTFEAYRIEIHLPSEHMVTKHGNSNRPILELQIHHRFHSSNLMYKKTLDPINVKKAVISILFEIGNLDEGDKFFDQMGVTLYNYNKLGKYNYPKVNSFFGEILHRPATYGPGFNYVAFQGLMNLINANSELFFYFGSQNVPPCTEDTIWMIFSESRSIPKFQFSILKKLFVKINEKNLFIGNNRPLKVKLNLF